MELALATCPGHKLEKKKLQVSSVETSGMIFLQVLPPYLLAGLGMVIAGMLLDQVQVSGGQNESWCACRTKLRKVLEPPI